MADETTQKPASESAQSPAGAQAPADGKAPSPSPAPAKPAPPAVPQQEKAAVEEPPKPAAKLVDTLPDGTKVKVRLPRMRACDEKDAKGKLCAGHLKRWYFFGEEIAARFGKDAEIYRCEHCKTLYLPNPEETPRSGTLAY